MAPAHHLSGERYNRKVVNQAFQDRVATRPSDAVEDDVALTDSRDEAVRRKSRQEDAMIFGVETDGFERAPEPASKHLGDAAAASELDKSELTVRNLGGNACKNFVKLRQIFWQGLTAPIDDGTCAQTKLRPVDRNRRNVGRLIIDRKIWQPDQLFGIVIRGAFGFHEIAADEVIDRRKSAGNGMSPGGASANIARRQASSDSGPCTKRSHIVAAASVSPSRSALV